MNNFLIRDGLLKLKEKNYDKNINNTIDFLLEKYDEEQILLLSKFQGLKIDNNVLRLFFIHGIGFRCQNEKINIIGRLPICNNIEKYMNQLYLDSYKNI